MGTKLYIDFKLSLIFLFVFSIVLTAAAEQENKSPSIEGTYKFVSRKLPDGSTEGPPEIFGLLTYTKDLRNFNIMWKDKDGKIFSISYIASYKLTPTEYSETSIYYMQNDEIGGKGISYDFSGKSGSSTVKIEDGRTMITLPLHDEPNLVFEGDKFTATKEGKFTDYWEKVQ